MEHQHHAKEPEVKENEKSIGIRKNGPTQDDRIDETNYRIDYQVGDNP